jgi:hypothetical protein
MALVSLMIQLPSLNICKLSVHITVHVHLMEQTCIEQFHPFLTLPLYGSKWSVSGPGHPIMGKNLWLCKPQELVWTSWRRENKSLAPARNQTLDCSIVIIPMRYPVTLHYSRLITKPHPACKGCLSPCWFYCLIHSVYKSWTNFHDQFFGVFAKQLLA